MDPGEYEEWCQDRDQSDDELFDVVANHMLLLADVDFENEELEAILARKHGGSRIGRSPNLKREHGEGHARILRDYFCDAPKYPPHLFRHRFRMRKEVFMIIHDKLVETCRFFIQRPDAIGNMGLSSIQKMVAAMRMFTYGVAADAVDEYIQIGESTAIQAFKEFADGLVNAFQDEYLRHPIEADVVKHMEENARRGFPGMFASLDCTHWIWKNCPYALQGQYRDKDGENSIILEAASSTNLWIWHAFVGIPGSNNDINVIDRSPLLVDLLNGVAPNVIFQVNGHTYNKFYFLYDAIYLDFSIFVKTISNPEGAKRKFFAKRQESCRKDIERCFGVLQARFAMIRNPSKWWDEGQMITVWKAAIIMHNMIIRDEESLLDLNHEYLFDTPGAVTINNRRPTRPLNFEKLSSAVNEIRNSQTHFQLQEDLVQHLWEFRGQQSEE